MGLQGVENSGRSRLMKDLSFFEGEGWRMYGWDVEK
jgi:hypothetical protein